MADAMRFLCRALLTAAPGHTGRPLDSNSLERRAVWMDLYAQRQGHFSDAQATPLTELRRELAPMLDE